MWVPQSVFLLCNCIDAMSFISSFLFLLSFFPGKFIHSLALSYFSRYLIHTYLRVHLNLIQQASQHAIFFCARVPQIWANFKVIVEIKRNEIKFLNVKGTHGYNLRMLGYV